MIAEKFWDQWNTLDKHLGPDGGDSCQRIGMYYSLLAMMHPVDRLSYSRHRPDDYMSAMKLHHVAPGVFIRHPNTAWDASDWDRMSRDQFQPMVIAAGFYPRHELNKIAIGHLKRGFLFTNNTRRNGATKENHGKDVAGEVRNYDWKLPDPTLFDVWGNFIRAYRCWFLYPLLLFFDIEMFLGAIKWRYFPPNNIAMNFTLSMLQAYKRMSTPWSYIARKVMPFDKLATLIGEHFHDFDREWIEGQDDMVFFEDMFRKAAK